MWLTTRLGVLFCVVCAWKAAGPLPPLYKAATGKTGPVKRPLDGQPPFPHPPATGAAASPSPPPPAPWHPRPLSPSLGPDPFVMLLVRADRRMASLAGVTPCTHLPALSMQSTSLSPGLSSPTRRRHRPLTGRGVIRQQQRGRRRVFQPTAVCLYASSRVQPSVFLLIITSFALHLRVQLLLLLLRVSL